MSALFFVEAFGELQRFWSSLTALRPIEKFAVQYT